MKQIIKSIAIGLGIAFAIFCIAGIKIDISNGGNFQMSGYSYTKMVCYMQMVETRPLHG